MLISIIIPTFNRYSVLRSVSSVLEQNLGSDDFEVIILDDCSTTIDHERLSNALESLGNNIQYIQYKSNEGPGKLRNHGISLAKGKYLIFLDSDDFIAPNALPKMIEEAENTNSEVVVTRKTWLNGKDSESISTKRNSSSEAYWNTNAFHSMTPQGKLFARSLIDRSGCRFSETRRWGEDQPFVTCAYIASKAVSVLNDKTYVHLGLDDQNLTRARVSIEHYFQTFIENVHVIRKMEHHKQRSDDLVALNFVRTAMRGIILCLNGKRLNSDLRSKFLYSLHDIEGSTLTQFLDHSNKTNFLRFLDDYNDVEASLYSGNSDNENSINFVNQPDAVKHETAMDSTIRDADRRLAEPKDTDDLKFDSDESSYGPQVVNLGQSACFVCKVVNGRGIASSDLDVVYSDLSNLSGKEIFPGSLNLILNQPVNFDVSRCIFQRSVKGINRFFWRAKIQGYDVFLYRWHGAPLHILEVLSDVYLRDKLNINTGDYVEICIDGDFINIISEDALIAWKALWLLREDSFYSTDEVNNITKSILKPLRRMSTQQIGATSESFLKFQTSNDPLQKQSTASEYRAFPNNAMLHQDQKTRILNILEYTKESGSPYSASKFPAGYHEIMIGNEIVPGQRSPRRRFQSVPIDFTGKTVLDIGCNQGGMLFAIQDRIKWAVGLDYDYRMINACNLISRGNNVSNCGFYVFDIDKEPHKLIHDFLPDRRVDVVFLLSICMWVDKWREIIQFSSSVSDMLLFEANGSEAQQAAQIEFLNELFNQVDILSEKSDDDPSQKKRKLLIAHNMS